MTVKIKKCDDELAKQVALIVAATEIMTKQERATTKTEMRSYELAYEVRRAALIKLGLVSDRGKYDLIANHYVAARHEIRNQIQSKVIKEEPESYFNTQDEAIELEKNFVDCLWQAENEVNQ